MELIKNVQNWWKLWSVQAFSLIAILGVIQSNVEQFLPFIPEGYHGYVYTGIAFIGIITRLIKQADVAIKGLDK